MSIENVSKRLEELHRLHWSYDYRNNFERGETYLREWFATGNLKNKRFFAVTLTPQAEVIHAKGIWGSIDARERFVNGLWKNLKHPLNRQIHNNYQRHPEFVLRDLVFIEHRPSNPNSEQLENPHLHGTIAVDKSRVDRLYDVLTPVNADAYYLNLKALHRAENGIQDVLVKPITTKENLTLWTGYATKQQEGNKYEYQQECRLKRNQSI